MKLMIIDGNSIANRAFFGVRPLTAPDGTPTNAVFGFFNILFRLMDECSPDALCVSFDVHEPTFRHRACESYKQGRRPMPDELKTQMPIIKELLSAMNVACLEKAGYEADDIIGTVSRCCDEEGTECIVVTGDKDSLQLVSGNTTVCLIKTRAGKTDTIYYTPERFQEEYGFAPKYMVDLKALMGDSSDNIPGVPGIGEKTALSLLQTYGSLEAIYADPDALQLKDSVKTKLAAGRESAFKSYWLATIFKDVPCGFKTADHIFNRDFKPELYTLLRRLGLNKMIDKLRLRPSEFKADYSAAEAEEKAQEMEHIAVTDENHESFIEAARNAECVAVYSSDNGVYSFCTGDAVYELDRFSCMTGYDAVCAEVFSAEVRKICHGLKNMIHELEASGFGPQGFVFDTELAAYLISSTDSDYSLSTLSEKYLSRQAEGAEAVLALYLKLNCMLSEYGVSELYHSIELPLCNVLSKMEDTGFLVDRSALVKFGESLSRSIDALQEEVYSLAGHSFNINSPKQLGQVLFEELNLPYGKKTKTGWSTNADVLDNLRGLHPIADAVLDYRELSKLKSTYADGLLKVISSDGRIHTNFQMTVTATGRLSSTEPNLQNIPVRKKTGALLREMFIAAPGNVLVDADYSQIELRILAHMADDAAMIDAFRSGEDFHTVTAAKVFGLEPEEVSPVLRSRAKAVNFGIVYGISAFSLSQDIGVSVAEAKEFKEAYFAQFRSVKKYMDNVIAEAESNGYVRTLFGRRRDMPELKNSNRNIREFGKRVALNMPVQGTAADVIKLAMIKTDENLRASGLKARLVLQVHDELIVECPEEEAETAAKILKETMENCVQLSVPLVVEVGCGSSWAEAH